MEKKLARGKQNMELIANERARKMTFQKRKNGLMKKAYEFSTLCDVDVCIILYSPDDQEVANTEPQFHTWPSDPNEVKRIISRFDFIKKHKPFKSNACDVFDILSERKRRISTEISKARKVCYAAKYPTWHEILNYYSNDQMGGLLNRLDSNIEALGKLINFKKEVNKAMKTTTSLSSSNQNRVDFSGHQLLFQNPSYIEKPIHSFNPVLDQTKPLTMTRSADEDKYFQAEAIFDSHLPHTNTSGVDQSFNYDPTTPGVLMGSTMPMMLNMMTSANEDKYFEGEAIFDSHLPYSNTNGVDQSFNYDPATPGVLMGSAMPMMLNNGASTSDANQQYFRMLDSGVSYNQYPILPSISTPQMHDSQENDTSYLY